MPAPHFPAFEPAWGAPVWFLQRIEPYGYNGNPRARRHPVYYRHDSVHGKEEAFHPRSLTFRQS
jgi:hypothetical protein